METSLRQIFHCVRQANERTSFPWSLIVLNLLDSSAVVDVVQSIELLIERRKILQLDCLSRSRLVARLADTLPMSLVYHQIFTYFL